MFAWQLVDHEDERTNAATQVTIRLCLLLLNDLLEPLLHFAGADKIVRNLVGPYITSLEMAGTSITLLKMDDDMIKLWDAPVKTPGLRWGI